MKPNKPGPGWRHLAGGVYEHQSGMRLHMLGMLRLSNGEFVNANTDAEYRTVALLTKANGGNRKRGLMAWARGVQRPILAPVDYFVSKSINLPPFEFRW